MPRVVDTEFARRLGVRIRAARLASHLSQTAVAGRLGVSFQQIQKYETGKDRLSVEVLVRIADTLGRPATDFLDPEERAA